MVGAVGHQGGEMSYGADFYPKAFRILLGTSEEVDAADGTPPLPESSDVADSPDDSSEADESEQPVGEAGPSD